MNQNAMDTQSVREEGMNKYIAKVFGWMFLGLMATALTTGFLIIGSATNQFIFNLTVALIDMIWIIFILQIAMVVSLARKVETMRPTTAKGVYLFYAMSNGVTVGLISFLVYPGPAVAVAFMLTAISFGTMSVYGLVTKSDLTKMGNILGMAVFGLIIIMVFNIFMRSEPLNFMISIAGLFIFLALTVRDTQKIKGYYNRFGNDPNSDIAQNVAILGALGLYLDFINIFMFFLRIISRNNRR
jgi:uncharacterized protein